MATSVSPARLDQAILATVAYADIFDFPLDRLEIHRDLIGIATTADATCTALDSLVARGQLPEDADPHPGAGARGDPGGAPRARARAVALAGRPPLRVVDRAPPFVRLVAVSGSPAADNPDPRADLDYLIVTTPGRLWPVRAMTILIVRAAARLRGIQCPKAPNYLLTTRALVLAQPRTLHRARAAPDRADRGRRHLPAHAGRQRLGGRLAAQPLPCQASAAPALPATATALGRARRGDPRRRARRPAGSLEGDASSAASAAATTAPGSPTMSAKGTTVAPASACWSNSPGRCALLGIDILSTNLPGRRRSPGIRARRDVQRAGQPRGGDK
ncbi:MAG: hypothetical protein U0232_01600 [Thermomicrobiales bacterium]